MNTQSSLTEFEDLCVAQLHKEHEIICWRYKLPLYAPVIHVHKSHNILGRWDSQYRTISLSAKIFHEYSWDTVLNIFKHEIAHQICSEMFHEDARHCEQFHKACELIDVPPAYRRPFLNYEEFKTVHEDNGRNDQWDNLIVKIKKLYSLAGSSNEYESLAALAKAKQLIDKYHISHVVLEEAETIVYKQIILHKKKIASYQQKIAALLSRYFYVHIIQTRQYNQHEGCMNPVFEVFGRPGNVEFALHCFQFLEERVRTLWQNKSHALVSKTVRFRNSFMLGILAGVEEQLIKQENEKKKQQWAKNSEQSQHRYLLQTVDKALHNRIKKRYPHLQRKKTGRQFVYTDVFSAGKKEGSQIQLHGAISKNSKQKLLPQ